MQAIYENKQDKLYCNDSTNRDRSLACRPHLHYQIELALVFEGHTHITVDGNEYDVLAGDAFVVFPNQIHTYTTVEKEKFILLIVSPELIPELFPQITSSVPKSALIKGGADEELSMLIKKISNAYFGNEPFKDAVLRGLLLVFFAKLLQKAELCDDQNSDYHVVGLIMNYCNENFQKPLSLNILSKELHLNKYYISHIMNNKLNMGFNDYINSLRVSSACKLLTTGDSSVTEISEAVGFNTLRTFNRAFLKQIGITPSEYRRIKRNEGKSFNF